MRYLLDTDTCIFLINRKPGYDEVLRHLDGLEYGNVLVSAVTLAELRFGVAKSERGPRNQEKLERFLVRFAVADFDSDAAAVYGALRADLERKGTPIGPLDMMIAAQSLSREAILVTNNVREFSRVMGLRWENWISSLAP